MGISDTTRQPRSYHPVRLLPGILFALLLAGRAAIAGARWPGRPRFGYAGALGPDDDPEFLRLLDHRIRELPAPASYPPSSVAFPQGIPVTGIPAGPDRRAGETGPARAGGPMHQS